MKSLVLSNYRINHECCPSSNLRHTGYQNPVENLSQAMKLPSNIDRTNTHKILKESTLILIVCEKQYFNTRSHIVFHRSLQEKSLMLGCDFVNIQN